jgi:hypothetical protein
MNLTTQLEAVNTLLATIGESPVNALNSGLVEASDAEQTLANVSREVQAKGWSFNTDLTFKLTPDASGELKLPSNCLHVDTTALRMGTESDLVQRGMRMYDRIKNTYAINTTIEVDMVMLLGFEELPEAVRRYITIRAARILQDRSLGSESLHSYNSNDEHAAWIALVQNEADVEDLNIFDNYSVREIAHSYR